MRLEQIKYFVTIAQCSSISLAAAELNISQPSISVAISDLEKELGVKLFDRTRRGTILCEDAKPFLKEAREILFAMERFLELSKKHNDKPKQLHMASVPSVPKNLISNIFLTFKKNYEHISIDVATQGSRQTIKDIQEWNVDIGLIATYNIPELYRRNSKENLTDSFPIIFLDDERVTEQIYFSRLYGSRMGICMSAKRAEKYGKSCSLSSLRGENMLAMHTYNTSLACYLAQFYPIFTQENISMYLRDYTTLFLLCSQDAGIALVNESVFVTAARQFGDSVRFLHITEEMPTVEYAAICLQSNMYMRSFRKYIELLHEIVELTQREYNGFTLSSASEG